MQPDDRPDCLGRFSLIDDACRKCKAKKRCVRRLNKGISGFTVLRIPHKRSDVEEIVGSESDKTMTAAFRGRGFDYVLYRQTHLGMPGTDSVFSRAFGLSWKWCPGPRKIVAYDGRGLWVVGFVRLDVRRVSLEFSFKRVHPETAIKVRAKMTRRSGELVWRLELDPNELRSEWSRCSQLLLESAARQTYLPSTST